MRGSVRCGHVDRPHYARYQCRQCWAAVYSVKARGRHGNRAARTTCRHPERKHYAKGRCKPCWQVWRRQVSPLQFEARERRYRERRPHREAISQLPIPDSRCRGLGVPQAYVAASVLDDLGKLYEPDFTSVCRKADYRMAA